MFHVSQALPGKFCKPIHSILLAPMLRTGIRRDGEVHAISVEDVDITRSGIEASRVGLEDCWHVIFVSFSGKVSRQIIWKYLGETTWIFIRTARFEARVRENRGFYAAN